MGGGKKNTSAWLPEFPEYVFCKKSVDWFFVPIFDFVNTWMFITKSLTRISSLPRSTTTQKLKRSWNQKNHHPNKTKMKGTLPKLKTRNPPKRLGFFSRFITWNKPKKVGVLTRGHHTSRTINATTRQFFRGPQLILVVTSWWFIKVDFEDFSHPEMSSSAS